MVHSSCVFLPQGIFTTRLPNVERFCSTPRYKIEQLFYRRFGYYTYAQFHCTVSSVCNTTLHRTPELFYGTMNRETVAVLEIYVPCIAHNTPFGPVYIPYTLILYFVLVSQHSEQWKLDINVQQCTVYYSFVIARIWVITVRTGTSSCPLA